MTSIGNLLLSRRRDESIVIDGGITITIVRIERGQVRLAIQAPKNVNVHRAEVWEAIKREKEGQ